jgi:hypothetical protein
MIIVTYHQGLPATVGAAVGNHEVLLPIGRAFEAKQKPISTKYKLP